MSLRAGARGPVIEFSCETSAPLDAVWAVLSSPSNLPRWDAGTLSARLGSDGATWEIELKPFAGGAAAPVRLRGRPAVERGAAFRSLRTAWTYEDGAFAVQDGWRVDDLIKKRRVSYALDAYRLRGWRAWAQWAVGPCFVDPQLAAYARKDARLLRALFPPPTPAPAPGAQRISL